MVERKGTSPCTLQWNQTKHLHYINRWLSLKRCSMKNSMRAVRYRNSGGRCMSASQRGTHWWKSRILLGANGSGSSSQDGDAHKEIRGVDTDYPPRDA